MEKRKLLGDRKKCPICNTSLRNDNTIGFCREHRIKSPIQRKKILEYRVANKDKIRKWVSEYTKKHRSEKREYDRIRWKLTKEKRRSYFRDYKRNREGVDILYKIIQRLRRRTWGIFSQDKKNKKTKELLGISPLALKKHLEKQFTSGMTWDNYGKWHIDHVIPLSSGKTKREIEKLCHYTNLQPLWAEDNLRKSKKVDKLK